MIAFTAWIGVPFQPARVMGAAVAIPAAALNVPADGMIGEALTFSVSFDNGVPLGYSGTAAGFGPYIDLIFPATGMDGDDGITFTSAAYLGASLTPRMDFFPGPGPTGCVSHPY
ncbi:MAG: hypothetical protein IH586_23015, partial [Anaerolineaceae bacterium]|nr:hypothetical protein [Anaerolineaceae bacterium]